jgi:carboxypeptidase D
MIWVEQPVGTGFSQGESTETSQEAVAASFLGFLKNFEETFNFKNKKIYIAGESYAGMYVPYIADAMFNSNDTKHFDVQGTMIYEYVSILKKSFGVWLIV